MPWAGLVYCNGTSNQWVACNQAAAPSTLTKADGCFCPSTSRTVAFTDASKLANIVQLPTATGGSVIWQPGFVPTGEGDKTITVVPTASTTSAPPRTSGPTQSSNTPPEITDPPSPGSSGTELSQSTKIGIGVGVGVGSAILLATLLFLFLQRRKRQFKTAESDNSDPSSNNQHHNALISGGTPVTPAFSELDSNVARPWSLRSELQGSNASQSPAEYQEMMMATEGRKSDGGLQSKSAESTPRPDNGRIPTHSPLSPVAELPG
jgi:hypothetical protein